MHTGTHTRAQHSEGSNRSRDPGVFSSSLYLRLQGGLRSIRSIGRLIDWFDRLDRLDIRTIKTWRLGSRQGSRLRSRRGQGRPGEKKTQVYLEARKVPTNFLAPKNLLGSRQGSRRVQGGGQRAIFCHPKLFWNVSCFQINFSIFAPGREGECRESKQGSRRGSGTVRDQGGVKVDGAKARSGVKAGSKRGQGTVGASLACRQR